MWNRNVKMLVLVFLLSVVNVYSQNVRNIKPDEMVWKRSFTYRMRTKDYYFKDDPKATTDRDTAFITSVIKKIYNHDLIAYDPQTDSVMQLEAVSKMLSPSVNSCLPIKLTNYYKVCENWTYKPSEGRVKIAIKKVMPCREFCNNDGSYRGNVPMFSIKYNDIEKVVDACNLSNTPNDIGLFIWKSYFMGKTALCEKFTLDNVVEDGMSIRRIVSHIVAIPSYDTSYNWHTVRAQGDINEDAMPPFEQIFLEVISNKCKVFSNRDLSVNHLISADAIKLEFKSHSDTIYNYVDENTPEKMEVNPHPFNFCSVNNYKVTEEWTFDRVSGITSIEIKSIAPLLTVYSDDGKVSLKEAFWMNYKDFRKLLKEYETYWPENTFDVRFWNDYFEIPASEKEGVPITNTTIHLK